MPWPVAEPVRVALLDDYQGVALDHLGRQPVDERITYEAFGDHLDDAEALVARLAPFDAVVAMRERTPLPRSVLEQLPKLRLLVTTGPRNAVIEAQDCADLGITEVGQVIDLGTRTDAGLLGLDEIADMHPSGQPGIRAQTGKGTNLRTGPHFRALDPAMRLDLDIVTDDRIFQHTERSDSDAVTQAHHALEYHVDVDHHILARHDRAA